MKIIEGITANKRSVSDLKNMSDTETLFIDNSFQRRYVWEEKHKIALIETILLGYDIPPIYLWKQTADPVTGVIKYSVVDGQQRIGAIVGFLNNKFPLKKQNLTDSHNAPWKGLFFRDLSDDLKSAIWSYSLNTMEIAEWITRDQIKTLFLRLNSTNKVLNPQELRNAKFEGKFIQTALSLAALDFWKNNNIFSTNDIRRMLDVEFVSQLLIFLRMGPKTSSGQQTINKAYDLYNSVYSEASSDLELCKTILSDVQIVIDLVKELSAEGSGISKITHIYTLFVFLYYLRSQNYFEKNKQDVLNHVSGFYALYFDDDHNDTDVVNYKLYSSYSVKSSTSRNGRLSALKAYVAKKCELEDI